MNVLTFYFSINLKYRGFDINYICSKIIFLLIFIICNRILIFFNTNIICTGSDHNKYTINVQPSVGKQTKQILLKKVSKNKKHNIMFINCIKAGLYRY